MKSKFTPIVKLKKEALDKQQRVFALINQELHTLQKELNSQKESLLSLAKPRAGDFSLFRQHQLFTTKMRAIIESTKDALARKVQEHNQAQNELNSVLQEFEKFKYLETQEEKALLEKIQKEEAQFLDEVAIMGYNNKKGKF